jgi:hypothetical protein
VTVNGIKMIVPCNTIIQMPANTVSWAMLFPQAGVSSDVGVAPVGTSTAGLNGQPGGPPVGTTGLALADAVATAPGSGPFPSFEIRALGNIVSLPNPVTLAVEPQYVIGLIAPVTQMGANAGFGMINCIDYANSFIYVGGDPAAPQGAQPCVLPTGAPNGARLQINDPVGRWGIQHSPEPLFSGDFNNSTVKAQTGFPMCVPRVAPNGTPDGGDPQCPAGNRPLNTDPRFPVDPFRPAGVPLQTFTMPPPPAPAFGIPGTPASNCPQVAGGPACVPAVLPVPPAAPAYPDARYQVPLMVGDWITYAGTVAKGNVVLAQPDYMSVHTLNANLGIFTAPHTKPAYVGVDVILLGTSGVPTNTIAEEMTTRIFIVGFTTNPDDLIDVNAVDVDPCTGVETLRLLGTVDPLTQVLKGRFRFHVLGGRFMPPTREMIITTELGTTPASDPFDPIVQLPVGVSNGFGSGQYRLPNFDFIFPENLTLGEPIVAANFQDLPFLARGSGPLLGTGSVVGQLTPWPGLAAPIAATCMNVGGTIGAAPIVDAGPNFVVASGLPEALFATLIQDHSALVGPPPGADPNAAPPVITWTQTAGPAAGLAPNAIDPLQPTFSTVGIAAGSLLTFQVSVTDFFGTSTSLVSVSVVDPATVDFLDPLLASAVFKVPKVQGVAGILNKGLVHRVGTKGGLLSVAATESINDRTISLIVMGWGAMEVDPVNGLPRYILKVLGNGGVENAPASVTVRSSRGGEVTIPVRIR